MAGKKQGDHPLPVLDMGRGTTRKSDSHPCALVCNMQVIPQNYEDAGTLQQASPAPSDTGILSNQTDKTAA